MFNFFRRKRGSTENLVDVLDKMPPEDDIRLPDENQNVETDRLVRNQDVRCASKQMQKDEGFANRDMKLEPVQKKSKKVSWAEVDQIFQENSDISTQESSSEEEEEEENENTSEEDEDESDDNESEEEEDNESEERNKELILEESPRLGELNELRSQLSEIERDMTAKSSLIDRLQTELRDAYQDAEIAKFKMSGLQIELEETKKNLELSQMESETDSEEEVEKAKVEEKLKEAEHRIHQLEEEIKQVKKEKEELEINLNQIKIDRDEEIKNIQKAYEDALKEQDEMILKFEEDFEELRTLNSRREQQLLDDFEWKLREVEKACKLRVEKREKDKDKEISDLVCQLASANMQLQEANKMKISKEELDQTKAANLELKRNLRTTNRRLEEVQVNEKVQLEETSRLRSLLDKEKSFAANLQIVHREELDERERKMNFRLEVQKNTLNSEWEDRLKRETRQLKFDMERRAREESNAAVADVKKQMDDRIKRIRTEHDEKSKQLQSRVEELKKSLTEKDSEHKEALINIQSRSDTELIEMRRKMEKLYMSYEEKIEKLNEQNEQQLSRLQEECDKKVQQVENSLHMQTGTTRATVELVKEQLQRDNQTRLQQLENQHQRQLEDQWCRMNKDKEDALKAQEMKHKEIIMKIQNEMEQLKNSKNKYHQKEKTEICEMKDNDSTISNLEKKSNQTQIANAERTNAQHSIRAELGEAEANLAREKDRLEELTLKAKMCQTIQQLTIKLDTSKKEIEALHSLLDRSSSASTTKSDVAVAPPAKEPPLTSLPTARVQPQNNNQQQSYNQSRRSRKHRSRRH